MRVSHGQKRNSIACSSWRYGFQTLTHGFRDDLAHCARLKVRPFTRERQQIIIQCYGCPGCHAFNIAHQTSNINCVGLSSLDQNVRLIEAAKLVQQARRDGRNVAEYDDQADIFSGEALHPVTEGFLSLLFRNRDNWTQPVSRHRIAKALRYYIDEAAKASPGIDLLGDVAPTPLQLIKAARRKQYDGPDTGILTAQPVGSSGQRDGQVGAGRAEQEQPGVPANGSGKAAGDGGTGAEASLAPLRPDLQAIVDRAAPENKPAAEAQMRKVQDDEDADAAALRAKLPADIIPFVEYALGNETGYQISIGADGFMWDAKSQTRDNPKWQKGSARPKDIAFSLADLRAAIAKYKADTAGNVDRNVAVAEANRRAMAEYPTRKAPREHFVRGFLAELGDAGSIGSIWNNEAERLGGAAAQRWGGKLAPELLSTTDATNPDTARRERQVVQLRSDAPLRKPVEQDDVDGLPMFDAERSPEMKFSLGRAEPGGRPASAIAPGEAARIERELNRRLRQLGIDDKVRLQLVDTIRALRNGKTPDADGSYAKGLIEVAFGAADNVWTLNHEAIHALRDLGLFKSMEWRALERVAKADTARMTKVRERYAEQGLTEDQLVEEAIGDMFADWASRQAKVTGFVRAAFQRVLDALQAVYSALKGQGFRTRRVRCSAALSGALWGQEMQPVQTDLICQRQHVKHGRLNKAS